MSALALNVLQHQVTRIHVNLYPMFRGLLHTVTLRLMQKFARLPKGDTEDMDTYPKGGS